MRQNAATGVPGNLLGIMIPVVHEPPVFADPTGRRHRSLRRAGLAAGAVMVVCLCVVVVALAGGPQAPFISWAVPHPASQAQSGHGAAGGHAGRPGHEPAAQQLPGPAPSPELSPSPSPSPQPSPSLPGGGRSATPSPTPTNPAGHTPPGLIHSKSPGPNPHKSPHGP
jgi:hypothetical protein